MTKDHKTKEEMAQLQAVQKLEGTGQANQAEATAPAASSAEKPMTEKASQNAAFLMTGLRQF